MSIKYFSKAVCSQIKYYVYRLIDPRNGLTFYIGKGVGNRIFSHINEADPKFLDPTNNDESKSMANENEDSLKIKTIKEIHQNGLEVVHIIQRWGMDEAVALEVESALIDAFFGLTNKVRGHNQKCGVCNAEWLEEKFSLQEYVDNENDPNYIIIKTTDSRINKINGNTFADRLYNAVRYAWKIGKFEAENIPHKYCLAVVNGVVKEVYTIEKWSYVPDRDRYEFEGKIAIEPVWEKYKNHLLPNKYQKKGAQSPILYKK